MTQRDEEPPRAKTPARRSVTPRRAPHRADSKEIVEAILDAATFLATKGLPHVTTNAIAKRAGVGVASVYRYFPNKEAIFAEIARRRHEAYLHALRAELATSRPLREGVEGLVRLLAVRDPADEAIRRMLNVDVPLRWSLREARTTETAVVDGITRWLAERHGIDGDGVRDRVFLLFGATRGVMGLRLLHAHRAPADEVLVEGLVEICLSTLRPWIGDASGAR
ncbi:MAG: TetR/AcrR family transcriptional regulator [Sandaracinaceae bacterium]